MTNRILLRQQLNLDINTFEARHGIIAGIASAPRKNCFVEQLVESIHRVEYAKTLAKRGVSESRADPAQKDLFNPLLAAIHNMHNGNLQEAFWLVFLFTHFGKGRNDPWRYSRELYGKLHQGSKWDWISVSQNPGALSTWINSNYEYLSRPGSSFGNHRKYESWISTGEVISSYVEWVGQRRDHIDLIGNALLESNGDSKAAFHYLYKSMSTVYRFGRTGKFDYLAMLGKLGLADIEPGYAYLAEATGPVKGGRILFGDPSIDSKGMEMQFASLAEAIGVGLQVMEDAVCNWQKSPDKFKAYRI